MLLKRFKLKKKHFERLTHIEPGDPHLSLNPMNKFGRRGRKKKETFDISIIFVLGLRKFNLKISRNVCAHCCKDNSFYSPLFFSVDVANLKFIQDLAEFAVELHTHQLQGRMQEFEVISTSFS